MRGFFKRALPVLLLLAFLMPAFSFAQTPTEEREQLEAELAALEEEIGSIEGDISKTQKEKKTLQNQISILKNQIYKVDLQIAKSNALITDLREQITDTTFSIGKTEEDIEIKRDQLADLLQRLHQEDQRTVVEIVLTGGTLSDFFNNFAALQSLQDKNKELLHQQ